MTDEEGKPQPTWIHLHFDVHMGHARPIEETDKRIDPYDLYKRREFYYPGTKDYNGSCPNTL